MFQSLYFTFTFFHVDFSLLKLRRNSLDLHYVTTLTVALLCVKHNFENTFYVFIQIINKNVEKGGANNRVLQQITRGHSPG